MRSVVMAGVLALSACAQQIKEEAALRGCHAAAAEPWRPLSGVEFAVKASSEGPDCGRAVATIVIRDVQGRVLWTDARAAEHVFTLRDARDSAAMERALAEWIRPSDRYATSAALPPWAENADAPASGEFPFYPEPGWDREGYQALRARNVPVFCYFQGMESIACLALAEGRLEKVGVQSFPG